MLSNSYVFVKSVLFSYYFVESESVLLSFYTQARNVPNDLFYADLSSCRSKKMRLLRQTRFAVHVRTLTNTYVCLLRVVSRFVNYSRSIILSDGHSFRQMLFSVWFRVEIHYNIVLISRFKLTFCNGILKNPSIKMQIRS